MTKSQDLLVGLQVVCLFLETHQGEGSELDSWLGEDCAIDSYNNTKITRQDNGQYVCCVALTCPQGTFAVACTESDPSTTHCKECEGDTYMDTESLSTDSFKCKLRRRCSAQTGLIRIDEGSIVQDAECQCDLERGYYNLEGLRNPTYCRGPKQCPAGEELTMDGDCRLCRPGMFKVSKGFASCQFWTHCEMLGFIIGEHGNRTADSTCVTAGVTTVAPTEMPTTDSKMKEWPSPRPRPRPGPRKVLLVFGVLVPLLMLLFLLPLYFGTVRRRRRKHMERERLTDDCGKEPDKALGSALLSPTWITDPELEQKSLVHPQGTKNEHDGKKNVKVHVHVLLPRRYPSPTTPGPACTVLDDQETGGGNGSSQAQSPEELSTGTRSLPSGNLVQIEGDLDIDADADNLGSGCLPGTLGPPNVRLTINLKQVGHGRSAIVSDKWKWLSA